PIRIIRVTEKEFLCFKPDFLMERIQFHLDDCKQGNSFHPSPILHQEGIPLHSEVPPPDRHHDIEENCEHRHSQDPESKIDHSLQEGITFKGRILKREEQLFFRNNGHI